MTTPRWVQQVDLNTQNGIVLSRLRDRYFDALFKRMEDGDEAAARLLGVLLGLLDDTTSDAVEVASDAAFWEDVKANWAEELDG